MVTARLGVGVSVSSNIRATSILQGGRRWAGLPWSLKLLLFTHQTWRHSTSIMDLAANACAGVIGVSLSSVGPV